MFVPPERERSPASQPYHQNSHLHKMKKQNRRVHIERTESRRKEVIIIVGLIVRVLFGRSDATGLADYPRHCRKHKTRLRNKFEEFG